MFVCRAYVLWVLHTNNQSIYTWGLFMKSLVIFVLVSLTVSLSACGEKKADYTVDELYQNKELRRELLTTCKEKLSQIGNYEKLVKDEPNCSVAQAAEERYSKEFNSNSPDKQVQKWN